MARFVEGKVVRLFTLKGKEVVFRYPEKSDFEDSLKHVNSLVKEKACILVQKKQTKAQQKKWFEETFQRIKKGNELKVCVQVDRKFAGSAGIERKKPDVMKHVSTLGIGLHRISGTWG